MEYDGDEIETDADPVGEDTEPTQSQKRQAPDEAEKKLVSSLCDRIKSDRTFHKPAFDQMREDMAVARRGAPKSWPKNSYVANITGRHINNKTGTLYAKNPRAVARRPEKLDFAVWDERETSVMQALEVMMTAATADPVTGALVVAPGQEMAVAQAQELLADYQQGMERRQMVDRIGKTLEILFEYFTREQTPLDFKTSMKQLVRRACTTGVGYVMLGFQREYGENDTVVARIADFRNRLDKIVHLSEEIEDAENSETNEADKRELELALKALEEEQYVLIREGLTFDFLKSTEVIPDQMCTTLEGFVGARWITVQRMHTREEVEQKYSIDLKMGCTKYKDDGSLHDEDSGDSEDKKPEDLACVWQHFDRETGVVYLMCDGYPGFLRDPGAPDVYVEDFWPVYALTFNDGEDDKNLYPMSDVQLMKYMQEEYNRSRQGLREHRQAARPRFLSRKGVLDDEEKRLLQSAQPFEVIDVNPMGGEDDLRKLVQAVDIPGVDPNLYETNPLFTDIQLTVGSSEAQFGMASGATATESSIAQSSVDLSTSSSVDDLDSFLTRVARAAGQIMLKEMSPETVMAIAGPGAIWPQLTLEEIASELFLEIQAGSSGKPNQTQEIRNWKEMLPFLIQMPNISPDWLARESLRRLDDKLDLTDAVVENIPSIMALNGMQQAAANGAQPEAQGPEGASNAPAPPGGPAGTDAPGGNNQQEIM